MTAVIPPGGGKTILALAVLDALRGQKAAGSLPALYWVPLLKQLP